MKTSRHPRLMKVLLVTHLQTRVARLPRTPVEIVSSPGEPKARPNRQRRKRQRRKRRLLLMRVTRTMMINPRRLHLSQSQSRRRKTQAMQWTLMRRSPSPSLNLNPRRRKQKTDRRRRNLKNHLTSVNDTLFLLPSVGFRSLCLYIIEFAILYC